MGNIRRTTHAFFCLEDKYVLDVASIFQGAALAPAETGRVDAVAVLTGERHSLDQQEWAVLTCIPSDVWVDAAEFDPRATANLLEKALIVSDSDDSPLCGSPRTRRGAHGSCLAPVRGALSPRDAVERGEHRGCQRGRG